MASLQAAGEKSTKKKRTRTFTADDRATHRLIEKQRREALNESFLELARLLPELAHVRHLSKPIIVNGSISHLQKVRAINSAIAPEIRSLLSEYESVLAEVNVWRSLNAQTPRPRNNFITGAIKDILNVEQEEFGTWPKGFEENRSNIHPEVEASDEVINGVNAESQHTPIRPMANLGADQGENSSVQLRALENLLDQPDAQMGWHIDENMQYFLGVPELDFHDSDNLLFTMRDNVEDQIIAPISGHESNLLSIPERILSNSTSHHEL